MTRLGSFLLCLAALSCSSGVVTPARAQDAVAKPPAQPPRPTDQPPPDVPLPSPIPLGRTLLVGGALDGRYRSGDPNRSDGAYLQSAEVDFARPITRKGNSRGGIIAQVIAEDAPDASRGRGVSLGEAYGIYLLPIGRSTDSTAYVKFGQFQIPFGLLAVYDPHLTVIQPLYAQSLGLRLDFGLAVSGRFFGVLNYDFALTTGSGPNRADTDPNRVVTFRLGRTFTTRNGTVNVGGSLLQGRLPVTDIDSAHPYAVELPPSGRLRADRGAGFVSKSRIAGDATYAYKGATARGEIMTGADDDNKVSGGFGEISYKFTPQVSAAAALSLFYYPLGDSRTSRTDLGLTYAPVPNLTFRAVYEDLYDGPRDRGGLYRHRFIVQALLRF